MYDHLARKNSIQLVKQIFGYFENKKRKGRLFAKTDIDMPEIDLIFEEESKEMVLLRYNKAKF